MEAVGLAVGIASLYSTFLEVLKHVDAYKSYGADAKIMLDRYEASKVKLQQWAESVGVIDGQLATQHDARLDDPRVAPVVKNILQCLTELFDKAEYTSASVRLPVSLQSAEANSWSIPREGARHRSGQPQPVSMKSRLAWAMGRKDRFAKDIHNFEGLINIILDIVPLHDVRAQSLIDESVLDQKLELLSDLEAGLDKLLEVATTQRRNNVESWINAIEDDHQYERSTELRLDGTCDWIFGHSAYQRWESEDFLGTGAKLLWICGPQVEMKLT